MLMNKIIFNISRNLWLAFPVAIILLLIIMISKVNIPLGKQAINETIKILRNIEKKREASTYPQKEIFLRGEIELLDSMLKSFELLRNSNKITLIEELYNYANSSDFTIGKVEIGIPQNIAGRRETGMVIEGKGSYRAAGAFIERIENCTQSTRIRQLIIKGGEESPLDVFIDLTLRE